MKTVTAHWLGRMRYGEAHALQARLVEARSRTKSATRSSCSSTSRSSRSAAVRSPNVLADAADVRASLGVEYSKRGGEATSRTTRRGSSWPTRFFDLEARSLRRPQVRAGSGAGSWSGWRDHGIAAGVVEGDSKMIGVWVDRDAPRVWRDPPDPKTQRLAKIGAIGVRLSRWVTMRRIRLQRFDGPARFRAHRAVRHRGGARGHLARGAGGPGADGARARHARVRSRGERLRRRGEHRGGSRHARPHWQFALATVIAPSWIGTDMVALAFTGTHPVELPRVHV